MQLDMRQVGVPDPKPTAAGDLERLPPPDLKPQIARLSARVLFQPAAVAKVAAELAHLEHGPAWTNDSRPIAKITFLGPPGVGKTDLAYALAEDLLERNQDLNRGRNAEEALLPVDCARFPEKTPISDIVGSSTGYIGSSSDRGGYVEPIFAPERMERHAISFRRRDGSIGHVVFVLCDEVSRAGSEFQNVLFQALDRGTMTLGGNQRIEFRNVVFIFTSNLGSAETRATREALGFRPTDSDQQLRAKQYLRAFEQSLDSGFVSRTGAKIVFDDIRDDDLPRIFRAKLKDAEFQWARRGFPLRLELSEEMSAHLCALAHCEISGARPAVEALRNRIISRLGLHVDAAAGHRLLVDYDPSADQVHFSLDRSSRIDTSCEIPSGEQAEAISAKAPDPARISRERRIAFGLLKESEGGNVGIANKGFVTQLAKVVGGCCAAGVGYWAFSRTDLAGWTKIPALVTMCAGLWATLHGIVRLRRSAQD